MFLHLKFEATLPDFSTRMTIGTMNDIRLKIFRIHHLIIPLNLSTTYTWCLRVTIGILSADKKVPNDNVGVHPDTKKTWEIPFLMTCNRSDYLRFFFG